MPQPEEFINEEEILEDSDFLEGDDDLESDVHPEEDDLELEEDFGDEDDFDDEDEDEDEDFEDEEEEMVEEYEVVATSDDNTAQNGVKTKRFPDAEDKSGKNKSTIASKVPFQGVAKIPDKSDFTMKEHLVAMFDGEDLSEEFKEKAVAIFEAAINERYDAIVARLEEAYVETIEENTQKILDELAERVNDYISYIAEEWLQENRLIAESGIKVEIAENFLQGMKGLFEENFIQVPEEKIDLIAELEESTEALKNEINEKFEENVALRKEITALRCNDIFESYCDGLADTQVEKLRTLAEGIEFDSEDMFENKLAVLKESYFGNARRVKAAAPARLDLVEEIILDSGDNEQFIEEETKPTNSPVMQNYVSALGKKGLKSR